MMFVQFEAAFPRILERICAGATLTAAVENYPLDLDLGAFTTWMYKDAQRKALYADAKEVRAETWTGVMYKHALGETPHELDRSKFVVDTLKWLVSRHARKEYGDTKTLEVNTTIDIRAALSDAHARVIDATVIDGDDIDLMQPEEFKQLSSGEDAE